MVLKKLTALLLCALTITGAALAADVAASAAAVNSETKSATRKNNNRYSRNRKQTEPKQADNVQWTGPVNDTVVSGGGYRHNHGDRGSSCSTGSCGVKKASSNSHACKSRECGQCHRAEIPAKPCCEKAVTVYTEPCLHKQVQYSWTCPVEYAETNCPTC